MKLAPTFLKNSPLLARVLVGLTAAMVAIGCLAWAYGDPEKSSAADVPQPENEQARLLQFAPQQDWQAFADQHGSLGAAISALNRQGFQCEAFPNAVERPVTRCLRIDGEGIHACQDSVWIDYEADSRNVVSVTPFEECRERPAINQAKN